VLLLSCLCVFCLLGVFLVELFCVVSLNYLCVVIYRNSFTLAKCVYNLFIFVYFTENALVFPREYGGYFGSVFFSYGSAAGISLKLWSPLNKNIPLSYIFIDVSL
jgi:hypothetical protein